MLRIFVGGRRIFGGPYPWWTVSLVDRILKDDTRYVWGVWQFELPALTVEQRCVINTDRCHTTILFELWEGPRDELRIFNGLGGSCAESQSFISWK